LLKIVDDEKNDEGRWEDRINVELKGMFHLSTNKASFLRCASTKSIGKGCVKYDK